MLQGSGFSFVHLCVCHHLPPFQKGFSLKGFAVKGANYFLKELNPIEKEAKLKMAELLPIEVYPIYNPSKIWLYKWMYFQRKQLCHFLFRSPGMASEPVIALIFDRQVYL